jgi:hypothetical protein
VTDRDGNGVPDACESLPFHRGDANGDGDLDISDPIFSLKYLFAGGSASACLDAADANDDGMIDLSDVVSTLEYAFKGAVSLPSPGAVGPCGADPESIPGEDGMDCQAYAGC